MLTEPLINEWTRAKSEYRANYVKSGPIYNAAVLPVAPSFKKAYRVARTAFSVTDGGVFSPDFCPEDS